MAVNGSNDNNDTLVLTERYRMQLAALLPQGPALLVETGGDLSEVLNRMAQPLANVQAFWDEIDKDLDPRTTVNLIDEWEASLGLPDSCSIGTQTLAERQAAVYAKYTDLGGARIPRYLKLAEAMGYPNASTRRYRMHTVELTCEEPVYEASARFAWSLLLSSGTRAVESTVLSGVEEPLRTWGDAVLECVILRENVAVSDLTFAYA